jgi:ADP-ribose pyrophosphatase YjhB (NUDIX family)
MENKRFGLGVFACIFNKDFSKILLVKRNEEKRKKYGADWGNIGGKIEFGETSIQGCLREIREEIGLKLKTSDLILLQIKEQPNYHPTVHGIHFIYAASIDEKEKIVINDESEEYRWFSMKNLPDKMLDSEKDIIGWWKKAKEKD